MKWAVSLVFAYGHLNIPLGCEWVHMDEHTHLWPLRVVPLGWEGDDRKECDGDDVNDMLDNFSDMEFDWNDVQ